MTAPQDRSTALALAMQVLATVSTVVGMILVLGLGGHWLDRRLGTGVFAGVGFALGLAFGMYYLLRALPQRSDQHRGGPDDGASPTQG